MLRQDFLKILGNFESVLAIPANERTTRDRDSAILRFELTYEVCEDKLSKAARELLAAPRQSAAISLP